jgi:UPF0755 protein
VTPTSLDDPDATGEPTGTLVDDLHGDGGFEEDGDYVYLPPESSRLRKALWVLGGLVAFALAVFALGGWWVVRQIDPGDAGEPVEVTIPTGATVAQAATLLEDRGVITNATVFQYYARWKNLSTVKAGLYDGLRERSAMADVVERLEAGPLPPRYTELVIPEGLWLTDIAGTILTTFPQMNQLELLTALQTVRSRYQPDDVAILEGLLFPATYRVEEGDELDEQKLVRQMVDAFEATAAEVGLDQAPERLAGVAGDRVITPYEVVIVASLIEKETSRPEERPMIARVIYNRLARGMTLGIDASVLYAIGEQKDQITRRDLEIDSPYNTRKFPGLPPTPISAPGRASLEAALNPVDGPWLYYVIADTDGRHFFTDDYEEFLDASDEARSKGLL